MRKRFAKKSVWWGSVAAMLSAVLFFGSAAVPTPAQAAPGDEVVFADTRLKECVAVKLGVQATAVITQGQLASMTAELDCQGRAIVDIAPLRYATNLTSLNVSSNRIVDLSPLAGLQGLTVLRVWGNQIVDLSPLTGLTRLTSLYASNNQIVNISPLANLTQLDTLSLANNKIVDVQPLAGLTNIQRLDLYRNKIANIEPLAGLTNVNELDLGYNQIVDVQPVAKLKNLKDVTFFGNQIVDVSPLAQLSQLTRLSVGFNNIVDLSSLAVLTNLKNLSAPYNKIADISPLSSLVNLTTLWLADQSLDPVDTLEGVAVAVPAIRSADRSSVALSVSKGSGSIAGGNVVWTAVGTSKLQWDNPVTIGSANAIFGGEASYNVMKLPKLSGNPPVGTVGKRYVLQLSLEGWPTPTTTFVSGQVPEWLSVSGSQVAGTPTKAGTYTFTMEARNNAGVATATFTIKINPAVTPPGPVDPPAAECEVMRKQSVFRDVAVKQKFYREIDWMHCMKLSTGYADKTYRPKTQLSREAMAAFMFRLQAPKSYQPPAVSPFTDVPTSHKFYKEISWMKQAKLSTGYADGSYRPKDNLSREAMAAFIYRLEATTSTTYPTPSKSPFVDVPTEHKFYKEISWMKQANLSTGYSDGSYRPRDDLSREAMAAFIYRLVTVYRD